MLLFLLLYGYMLCNEQIETQFIFWEIPKGHGKWG